MPRRGLVAGLALAAGLIALLALRSGGGAAPDRADTADAADAADKADGTDTPATPAGSVRPLFFWPVSPDGGVATLGSRRRKHLRR